MSKKRWKAWMHFSKPGHRIGLPWTVHFRGKCHSCAKVQISGPNVSTEWKPGKERGVRAVVVVWATKMTRRPGKTIVLHGASK